MVDIEEQFVSALSDIESDEEIVTIKRRNKSKRCNLSSESDSGTERIGEPERNDTYEARNSPSSLHDNDSNSENEPESIRKPFKSKIVNCLDNLVSSDDDIPESKSNQFFSKTKKTSKKHDTLSSQISEFKDRMLVNLNSDTETQNEHNTRKVKEKIRDKFQILKKSKHDKVEVEDAQSTQTMQKLSMLCDSENSESDRERSNEEPSFQKVKKKYKKKERTDSEKHEKRISAKEAKENMKVILSESNRMLREKQVTLPYHRPKQLSLKDILNRRKPITGADGKSLPIKMNNEQLKRYAQQLEERQKEIIEMYKSDQSESEEETMEQDNCENKNKCEPLNIDSYSNKNTITCESDKNNDFSTENVDNDVSNSDNDTNLNNSDNETTAINSADNESSAISNIDNETTAISNIVNQSTAIINIVNESTAISNIDNETTAISNIDNETTAISNIDNEPTAVNTVDNESGAISNEDNVVVNHEDNKTTGTSDVEKEELNEATVEHDSCDNNKIVLANDIDSEVMVTDSENICLVYNTENTYLDSNDIHTKHSEGYVEITENNMNEVNTEEVPKEKSKVNTLDGSIEENKDNSRIVEDEFDQLLEEAMNENFSDVEIAEEAKEVVNTEKSKTFNPSLKPKIGGAPGTVINFFEEEDNPKSKKLSGLDKLRERFLYFTKIKTAEEIERENQSRIKPGTHHLKLKQELEEQIAEQRVQEWTKRLQEEKKKKEEDQTELSDCEEAMEDVKSDVDKPDNEEANSEEDNCEEEEELIEDDVELKDDKKKRHSLFDDEAEVTDEDESESDDEDDSSETSEDEVTESNDKKKSRILKAFEDSDDEKDKGDDGEILRESTDLFDSQEATQALVEEVPLEQLNKSVEMKPQSPDKTTPLIMSTPLMDTQSDSQVEINSILHLCSGKFPTENVASKDKIETATAPAEESAQNTDDLHQSPSKSYENIADISFRRESVDNSEPHYIKELVGSQDDTPADIGEELLDMCTGRFVGAADDRTEIEEKHEEEDSCQNRSNLDTILNDSEDEANKPNRFFKSKEIAKGRLIVSSDEENENSEDKKRNKRKRKRRDMEKRKIQISDDEDDLENPVDEENELDEFDNDQDVDKIIEYDSEENEVEVEVSSKKLKKMTNKFFENEAELTSEDEWAGSADEDERGLDRFEREAGDADDLDMDDVKKGLYRAHMREVMDQDKREVRLLQEILLEDGDLGGDQRQRKFRWKNADDGFDTSAAGPLMDGDEEEELESEEQWRRQRHERQQFLNSKMEKENEAEVTAITRTSIIKANLNSKTMSSMLLEAKSPNAPKKTPENSAISIEKKSQKDIPSPIKSGPLSIMQTMVGRSLLSRSSLARLAAIADPLADAPAANMTSLANNGKTNFVFASLTPKVAADDEATVKNSKRKADSDVGTPRLLKKIRKEDLPKKTMLQQMMN